MLSFLPSIVLHVDPIGCILCCLHLHLHSNFVMMVSYMSLPLHLSLDTHDFHVFMMIACSLSILHHFFYLYFMMYVSFHVTNVNMPEVCMRGKGQALDSVHDRKRVGASLQGFLLRRSLHPTYWGIAPQIKRPNPITT